jgi:hypothetical protein
MKKIAALLVLCTGLTLFLGCSDDKGKDKPKDTSGEKK